MIEFCLQGSIHQLIIDLKVRHLTYLRSFCVEPSGQLPLRWRVGARWYAVALLPAPLVATAVLLALSLTSPVYLPGIVTTGDKATLVLTGIAVGLVGASSRSSAGRGSPSPGCGCITAS